MGKQLAVVRAAIQEAKEYGEMIVREIVRAQECMTVMEEVPAMIAPNRLLN